MKLGSSAADLGGSVLQLYRSSKKSLIVCSKLAGSLGQLAGSGYQGIHTRRKSSCSLRKGLGSCLQTSSSLFQILCSLGQLFHSLGKSRKLSLHFLYSFIQIRTPLYQTAKSLIQLPGSLYQCFRSLCLQCSGSILCTLDSAGKCRCRLSQLFYSPVHFSTSLGKTVSTFPQLRQTVSNLCADSALQLLHAAVHSCQILFSGCFCLSRQLSQTF